jgi:hypothetical protein
MGDNERLVKTITMSERETKNNEKTVERMTDDDKTDVELKTGRKPFSHRAHHGPYDFWTVRHRDDRPGLLGNAFLGHYAQG